MARIEDGKLIIELQQYAEGTTLKAIQEALILGMEKISVSEIPEAEDHKNAVYWLAEILRAALLDDSQTNIGLGNKPYKTSETAK